MTKRTKRKVIRKPSSGSDALSTEQSVAAALEVLRLAVEQDIDCALCGGIAMQIYGSTRAPRGMLIFSLPKCLRFHALGA